ncbi:hypothetical protein KOW79_020304 [Hemibagrus wyckioides]|uniref:Sec16 Sec23-binding domain-containing protein n=1 Tax=Hemibagrus wyckioides TaxID=337641 RepID=A0A9D3N5J8_9TELE|nr:hypothetical protein KOW79_020304 [Hemibagrus wyckioides]
MRNCTEAFVPHPEEEEKKEYHSCSKGDDDVLQREEKYLSHGEIYAFPGPLMRANMQKDELMKFIQQKCQECLLHLDDPQQQKSYFFWTIMEHFHKKNGEYKCIHAYELAEVGLDAMALEYCEVIATTVLRFPKHIQSIVLEWLISLSKKLLQRKKAEEPEWLMKLRQLLKDKAEIRSSPDKPNCTSSDSEEHLEFDPSVHSEFNSRYTVGELLGTGGFGSVFAGVRKADEQPDLRIHLPPAAVMEKQMFAAGVFGIISGGQI